MILAACTVTSQPRPGTSASTNSLGMAFVRVHGAGVEFCIHETRERDLAAFQNRSSHSNLAATNVSWDDANAFCRWLTDKEHREGTLPTNARYRLPTDHEWSLAAGIGAYEDPHRTPEQKRQQITGVYPWGRTWPPPANAGNYFGSEARSVIPDATPVLSFNDHHPRACDVMCFAPNHLGIHDLGGNVWEWCADEFRPGTGWRVLRGAAWNCSRPEVLLSSHRTHDPAGYRSDTVGFRIVRSTF